MPALLLLPPPLLFCLSVILLCIAAAPPPPFPFDSFRIQSQPSNLLVDVDTPHIVLDNAWAAPDDYRFSPLSGLLPDAPVKLQVSRTRAEELIAALARAHNSLGATAVNLFIRTCVRLLEDSPVLPTALTPIGVHPTSFFPSSLPSDADADTDGDGSICFTSAELPLEEAMDPNMMLTCTGHADHDTCGYASEQLRRLHLTATLDSDSAPPLQLLRIYARRSTLYVSGDGQLSSQSVRLLLVRSYGIYSTCKLITLAVAAAQRGGSRNLPQYCAVRVPGAG
jgi:hypothetical protein